MTTKTAKRFGFKRWVLLGLMILGAWLAYGVKGIFTAISPTVILPAEAFLPGLVMFEGWPIQTYFTNTMASLLLAIILLFAMVIFVVQPFIRSRQQVPSGFYNFVEFLIEFFWNSTEAASGKFARKIFPFVMTIFLLVLSANLVKLLPFHETIGYLEPGHGSITGYETQKLFYLGSLPVVTLDGSHPIKPADRTAHATEAGHATEGEEVTGSEGHHACESDCFLAPMFRGVATDLNFTFALSIITMIMVQVFGFMALGPGYLTKFFNFTTIINKPFFGLMDTIVGLLELISEIAKVLSFGLRLFGTLFAGTLLLGILGVLVPVIIPGMLYGLETFVGLIQAYVFATLAQTFMSQAIVSHHGDEHAAEAH